MRSHSFGLISAALLATSGLVVSALVILCCGVWSISASIVGNMGCGMKVHQVSSAVTTAR